MSRRANAAGRGTEAPAILTREECDALTRRVLELVTASQAQVEVASAAGSTTEFARGDAHVARETATASVTLQLEAGGRHARVETDRLDDAGLQALVRKAEALARDDRTPEEWSVPAPQRYPEGPRLYFDATVGAMAADAQAALFRRATDVAESERLVAAGDVTVSAAARAVANTEGLTGYERTTYGEFSLTARTPDGTGSGWAWGGFEDWSRVGVQEVVTRATTLARRSANPVAVEPGRYTVILEPAAVAALVAEILRWWPAEWADAGNTVFSKEPVGTNKIGLQMLDRRLGMASDPWDPERPATTIAWNWEPIPGPVRWFEQGVLRNLTYSDSYARERGRLPVVNPGGVRLAADGPAQTLDEMIASVKRGVWVNRLSHVFLMNRRTLLLSGMTRDGTFLIENGKITKPIKNFRFTESPFFVLNKLEGWGEPVRASRAIVAPRLLLRDFNFTSLSDAI